MIIFEVRAPHSRYLGQWWGLFRHSLASENAGASLRNDEPQQGARQGSTDYKSVWLLVGYCIGVVALTVDTVSCVFCIRRKYPPLYALEKFRRRDRLRSSQRVHPSLYPMLFLASPSCKVIVWLVPELARHEIIRRAMWQRWCPIPLYSIFARLSSVNYAC